MDSGNPGGPPLGDDAEVAERPHEALPCQADDQNELADELLLFHPRA